MASTTGAASLLARHAAVLDLPSGAIVSADDIRSAYRRAALTAHPDRPCGSVQAFRAVHAAYEALLRKAEMHGSQVIRVPGGIGAKGTADGQARQHAASAAASCRETTAATTTSPTPGQRGAFSSKTSATASHSRAAPDAAAPASTTTSRIHRQSTAQQHSSSSSSAARPVSSSVATATPLRAPVMYPLATGAVITLDAHADAFAPCSLRHGDIVEVIEPMTFTADKTHVHGFVDPHSTSSTADGHNNSEAGATFHAASTTASGGGVRRNSGTSSSSSSLPQPSQRTKQQPQPQLGRRRGMIAGVLVSEGGPPFCVHWVPDGSRHPRSLGSIATLVRVMTEYHGERRKATAAAALEKARRYGGSSSGSASGGSVVGLASSDDADVQALVAVVGSCGFAVRIVSSSPSTPLPGTSPSPAPMRSGMVMRGPPQVSERDERKTSKEVSSALTPQQFDETLQRTVIRVEADRRQRFEAMVFGLYAGQAIWCANLPAYAPVDRLYNLGQGLR